MASLKQEKASISPIFLFYFERVHLITFVTKIYFYLHCGSNPGILSYSEHIRYAGFEHSDWLEKI